jgi:hypothetical protein
VATTNLIRWSGLTSLLGGVLYGLAASLHPVGEDPSALVAADSRSARLYTSG